MADEKKAELKEVPSPAKRDYPQIKIPPPGKKARSVVRRGERRVELERPARGARPEGAASDAAAINPALGSCSNDAPTASWAAMIQIKLVPLIKLIRRRLDRRHVALRRGLKHARRR